MLIKWAENVENGREGVFMVSHKAALMESRTQQWNKHCSPPAALYSQPLPCPITIWQDLMRLFVAHCARECFFGGVGGYLREGDLSVLIFFLFSSSCAIFPSVLWWYLVHGGDVHSLLATVLLPFTQIWLFVMTVFGTLPCVVLNSVQIL